MGSGAPGQRKGNGGNIIVRFADGLDGLRDTGQIIDRDAARLAAGGVCISQDAVIFFTVAAGAGQIIISSATLAKKKDNITDIV